MNNQTFRKYLLFAIVVLIGYFIGFTFGTTKVALDWKNFQITTVNKEPPAGTTLDMSQFYQVLSTLQTSYYNKSALDSQKMLDGAITGMVQTLGDPYTMYLPPTQNSDFKQNLAGQFTGIGAELGMQGKQIIVVSPLEGSPAQKAGIKVGDEIMSVDGQSTAGWTLSQAVDKIRGPKGSNVVLGIIHKGDSKTVNITIVRDTVTVKSVSGWVKKVKDIQGVKVTGHDNDEITYIQLSQFGDNTNTDWTNLVTKLNAQMQKDGNVKGMILDLRNNPGGYLTDAQFVASEFLSQGDTVVQEQSGDGQTQRLTVNRKGLFVDNPPLIVLINKGSASAAEIVSGALRDNNRARLVGETSFGKGTVQQAVDLGGGAGLHVTIAKWLTPNGTWLGNGKDGAGLTPDIQVAPDLKDSTHDSQLEKAIEELLQ